MKRVFDPRAGHEEGETHAITKGRVGRPDAIVQGWTQTGTKTDTKPTKA